MHNQDCSVVIRPKGRSPADEYAHKGRVYIEGRENSHYVIELTNHSHKRTMAVVSVDGLAITDGKPAHFDSRGFVLNPKQSIQIPGWLMDDQTAAEFVFAKKRDSYSNQMSEGGNEGVIGVAWFAEQVVPINYSINYPHGVRTGLITHDMLGSVGNTMVGSHACASTMTQSSMGTGFGESREFETQAAQFTKASHQPHTVQLIYYDSATNLQKMGIKLKERQPARTGPQAFPGSMPEYCAPPPSWAAKKW